jgi:tRNA A-37 threonylcarbamoyl transferase component Bud32/tetratricopeptide (TPR) repeat protein
VQIETTDTVFSPPRPEIGPEHNLWRRQIEAVLFGSSDEVAFGRYRVLHRIGEGGMGTVYAAYDEHLDRKIAVKLIRPSRLDSAELRERAMREARALARLSHPNVVHVYEVGEVDGQVFMAMEFLAGPTLRGWIDAATRPWREILSAYGQAGEGLAAAHAEGIIHRDFKPHNAMFGADDRVRVLDFGLARVGELERSPTVEEPATSPSDGLTLSGALLGTPAYMAPEQITARTSSAHSDQFSFCVALFEALYGHRPFAGETLEELISELTAGRIAARPRDTDVPRWVHAVLLRGLAVEPDSRWPSMRELLVALRRDPRARRRQVGAGALLVAFTGALSYAVAQQDAQHDVPAIDLCPDARDEIAAVWGETRAAELEAGVRAKHGAHAEELLAIIVPQIDRYARRWAELRNEACRAHAEGQQSSNVFDARTACLDQRRASLEALVSLFESASAEQLVGVAQAASDLPTLERCADVPALLAAIAPPEDPAIRARVQAHRETLARAQVHEKAGQNARGLELVAEVLADEEASAYQPLLAEAYLRKGYHEIATDPAAAERSLAEALWVALASGHTTIAAQASAQRAYVQGNFFGQYQRVMDDLPMITALNQRVIDDAGLYADYLNVIGTVYASQENWREARRWQEQALELSTSGGQPTTFRTLALRNNLGHTSNSERRYADAYASFREVAREAQAVVPSMHRLHMGVAVGRCHALGGAGRHRTALAECRHWLKQSELVESPAHMRVQFLDTVGAYEREVGELAASREHLLEGLELAGGISSGLTIVSELMLTAGATGDRAAVQAYHEQLSTALAEQIPAYRSFALERYGRALEDLGATEEAVAAFEQGLSLLVSPSTVGDRRMVADLSLQLGRAHRKLGNHDAAERELVRALAELRELYPVYGPSHADATRELGLVALDRGRFDEARSLLEQATAIYLASTEPDYPPLAHARFGLARALTGASEIPTPEALALAELALLAFHANARHDDARVVESWLATQHAKLFE